LYTEAIGEVGNGNEKGFSTAREGFSGVIFENLDFGEFGSDEITIPVFALNDEKYFIEIWEGNPLQGGVHLDTLEYHKPSIWNVYQEETWKLPKRLKGVTAMALMMRGRKVHIKGFSFKKCEKAFSTLFAAECDGIYGDSFTMEKEAVTGIGNNVTLVFENMNFGKRGAAGVEICSRSPLKGNTVHIQFTTKEGTVCRRILEIPGTEEYQNQYFELEPFAGEGKIEFVFLPGTNFDMKSCRFC
jgi:beta-galactosidase